MHFIFICLFILCSPLWAASKVLVSVAPSKYLVDKIGAEHVTCSLFVPPGTSPHSYEPSVRQVVDDGNALIWFRIGENFETRIVKLLQEKMVIIDLRDHLPLLSSCCCHNEIDTHIWLSPKLLIIQAQSIARSLCQILPEHRSLFEKNSQKLIADLEQLDEELKGTLRAKKRSVFLASHPAFGYFCHEYHVEELSIEISGKEPSPKQITKLLERAREKKVDLVITQPQYSNRGAYYLAKELNAKIISLDPYEENIVENLRDLAKALSQ